MVWIAAVVLGCSVTYALAEAEPNPIEVFDRAVELLQREHAYPDKIVNESFMRERITIERSLLREDSSDAALAISIMRVKTLIGDSHTMLECGGASPADLIYPIQFYADQGHARVWAVSGSDTDLLGGTLLSIHGVSWSGVKERLLAFCPGDNEYGGLIHASNWMSFPKIMREIGLADADLAAEYEISTTDGQVRTIRLHPAEPRDPDEWQRLNLPIGPDAALYRRDPTDPHWLQVLPEHNAVYAQYNHCNTGEPTTESFAEELTEAIERSGATKLIVDVRRNPGGLNYRNKPILHAIFRAEQVCYPRGALRPDQPRNVQRMHELLWLARA